MVWLNVWRITLRVQMISGLEGVRISCVPLKPWLPHCGLETICAIDPRRFGSSRATCTEKKSIKKKTCPCVRRERVPAPCCGLPLTLSTIKTLSLDQTFLRITSGADTQPKQREKSCGQPQQRWMAHQFKHSCYLLASALEKIFTWLVIRHLRRTEMSLLESQMDSAPVLPLVNTYERRLEVWLWLIWWTLLVGGEPPCSDWIDAHMLFFFVLFPKISRILLMSRSQLRCAVTCLKPGIRDTLTSLCVISVRHMLSPRYSLHSFLLWQWFHGGSRRF